MRRFVLVCVVAAVVAWGAPAEAQVFFDNFDSYANGSGIIGQGGWQGWGGSSTPNATVTSAQSFSSPHSLAVSGGADVVQTWGGINVGYWYAKAWTYVPSSQVGEMFFIILNTYDGTPNCDTCNWSIQVVLCQSGCSTTGAAPGAVVNLGGSNIPGVGSAALITDQWVELRAEVNLDANQYSVYYNNVLIDTQTYADLGQGGQQAIQCLDLFS